MKKHEITENIIAIISEIFKITKDEVTLESTFESLGADSLDSAEVIMKIEMDFNIEINNSKIKTLDSVSALADFVEIALNEKK